MKESYEEGVANRFGPESCVVAREGAGEALTGARPGWVLSREIVDPLRGADVVAGNGRSHRSRRYRETRQDLARSETPRMSGNTSHGSREIPHSSAIEGIADRTEKSKDARR